MDESSILRLALLSGLMGFVVFCLSYAGQVWRKRTRATEPALLSVAGLRPFAAGLLLFAGVAGILGGLIVREFQFPAGVLSGQELATVRARDDCELEELTGADAIAAGDVLARFRHPKTAAQADMIRLRLTRLDAARGRVTHTPAKIDDELTRAAEDIRHWKMRLKESLEQLSAQCYTTVRDGVETGLRRGDMVAKLESDVARLSAELDTARHQAKYSAAQIQRVRELRDKRATSIMELEKEQLNHDTAAATIEHSQKQIECLRREQEQLRASLRTFDALAKEQAKGLNELIGDIRRDLDDVARREEELAGQIAADKDRARRLQEFELRQIDAESREAEAELAGLHATVTVRAPFAGRVWYRDPSPRSIYKSGPLLVVGPEHGSLLKLRTGAAAAAGLEAAGAVLLRPVGGGLQRRFEGRFYRAEELPHEPGMRLVELRCVPPRDAIADLAEGKPVQCEVLWNAPPWSEPWYAACAVLVGVGVVGLAWPRGRQPMRVAPPVARPEPLTPRPTDAPRAIATEYGTDGAMLHLLAGRFRDAVVRQSAEPDVMGAVEWSLDRHHARAVRFLRTALAEDPAVKERVID